MKLEPVTDRTFNDKVLSSKGIVLVMFTAAWAEPCRLATSVLENMNDLQHEAANPTAALLMDIDANPKTHPLYHVRGLPTTLVFRNGVLVEKKVGAMGAVQVAALLSKAAGEVP